MFQTFVTQDGSIGLYNEELDEIYHSKFGARKEAYEKFVEPVLNIKNAKILDICYGIGYNTKTAIKYLKDIDFIDCIEIDKNLAQNSFNYPFEDEINKIIENNLKKPNFINFYFEDVRETIQKLDKKYDIIFHDGFAPHKQPELWSEELISKIIQLLDYNGVYLTYNHSKPVLCALNKTGITIGKTIKEGKTIGTIASYNSDIILNPLTLSEKEMLKTKSAITYKDPLLSLTSAEIIKNREQELKSSKLPTLSSVIKKQKTTTSF